MIYLDNAATTRPKPREVIQAVVDAMQNFGNSGRGTHDEALTAARMIYDTRNSIARLLGGTKGENVVFTANSTEALNVAIFGLLDAGSHIISTDLEHNSVLRPLYRLEKAGAQLSFLPADKNGQINLQDLEKYLQTNTKAVVCTHASNVTGDVVDITAVGKFCRKHHLLFILDASQTAGVFPINLQEQNIDVVCFTGHKSLLGPQGTGGLCFREGLEIRPWKTGGTGVQSYLTEQPSQYPTRLEAGTLNGHGLAGLHAALKLRLATGLEAFRSNELALARRFYEGVRKLPGVKVYGNFAATLRAPIVTLNIGNEDAAQIADELARRFDIATRPGAHCAPRLHRALGTQQQGAVRFSWSWANTATETDAAIEAIRILAEESK